MTSAPTQASAGTPAAGTVPASPTGPAPRFTTPEAVDAALADADRAIRASATPATARTDTAAGPPRPASAEITRETTVEEAATRLASDLRSVPGIERFAAVRLAELDRGGPRPLRAMWRVARDQLGERHGALTIGELLDRYG